LPFPGLDALAELGVRPEGISAADRARLEATAVPHPAGALREPVLLHDPRRNAVPATMVCCSAPSGTVRELAAVGVPMFAPLNDLTDLTLVDLPTGHWPMLSRPADLADLIAKEANRA
jgi:pimeloyl-ACP methyl ester carboxylesterase